MAADGDDAGGNEKDVDASDDIDVDLDFSDDEDILDYFDNLVIVNYSDGEGDDPPPPSSGMKRQAKDMEIDEEMDTSLNVKDLKAKSKSSRRKVAKISDVEPNVEMEEN